MDEKLLAELKNCIELLKDDAPESARAAVWDAENAELEARARDHALELFYMVFRLVNLEFMSMVVPAPILLARARALLRKITNPEPVQPVL